MRKLASCLALALAACAFVGPSIPPARAGDSPPPGEAVAAAKTAVGAARKAAKGDADTMKSLKATRAALEPFVSWARAQTGSNDAQFSALWNELMTVSEFHGVPGKPDYILGSSEVLWSRYLLCLPKGTGWSWKYNGGKDNDQLHMFVDQAGPGGAPIRQMKVWTYRWDTVYSGVGGENAKGLAKMMHEADRDSTARSKRKVSPAVVPKRMNAEFDHANYYFVEGFDVDEEKTLRRDNYYIKGSNRTFNFEIITYTDAAATDDAVTKWQRTESDPETRAMLAAIASNPNYKPQK